MHRNVVEACVRKTFCSIVMIVSQIHCIHNQVESQNFNYDRVFLSNDSVIPLAFQNRDH